jgi:hypothetical protein
MHPIEELRFALGSFVEQSDHFALVVDTRDEEVPLVIRSLDSLDEESPQDVYFVHTEVVGDAPSYVQGVVRAVVVQLNEVNEERQKKGSPILEPIPGECVDLKVDPLRRLKRLCMHMATWLPPEGDHRLVLALVPTAIRDREAHARIVGSLVPFHAYEPWMRGVRLMVREDKLSPFVVASLRKAEVHTALLYTTRVTVSDIADAAAAEAADQDKPEVQRINALLQCAALDVALGRLQPAMEKYGVLYHYYDKHNVLEMKATVVQGVGDVLGRVNNYTAARDKYLQALDIASDAKCLPIILNVTLALGEADMRLQLFSEAAYTFGIAADAAEKMMNPYARADALEKQGNALAGMNEWRSATEAWTGSAVVARDCAYDVRLADVLEHLSDLSGRAGDARSKSAYDRELREVRARLA